MPGRYGGALVSAHHLAGMRVLITGAGGGIGAATTSALRERERWCAASTSAARAS